MAGITDVIRDFGSLLAQHGVGSYTEDTYTSGIGPAIVLKKMPQSIDRCIVLNVVIQNSSRDIDTTDVYLDVMVQVRCRGAQNDPLDPDGLAESVAGVLNGLTQYKAGSYTVDNLTRRTHLQNGQDDNGRYEVLSQFYGQITAR